MGSDINGLFYTSLKPSVVNRQDLGLIQGNRVVFLILMDMFRYLIPPLVLHKFSSHCSLRLTYVYVTCVAVITKNIIGWAFLYSFRWGEGLDFVRNSGYS